MTLASAKALLPQSTYSKQSCYICHVYLLVVAVTAAYARVLRTQVVHQFYRRFTGLELERIEEECDRDNFMSPTRAIELGLIDAVISDVPGVPDRQLETAAA